MNCDAMNASAINDPMEAMDFDIASHTPFSFVNTPTVFPYAIPGSRNNKVISITIPLRKGEVGVPKREPFSFFKNESAGIEAITITATKASATIPAFRIPFFSKGEIVVKEVSSDTSR